jgi:hypothetical protein
VTIDRGGIPRHWGWGLLAVALVIAGCGEQSTGPSSSTPAETATPSATAIPSRDLKPMIHGLIDRNGPPARALATAVTAFVVNVTWAELQPTAYGPLATNNPIDGAITAARAFPGGMGVKIRLLTGIDSPAWVKQLDGGPVSVYSAADHTGGTIGRFWTADFGRAYSDLWTRLAAKYDSIPEIREITASRCMTVFAETFLRDTSDPTTVANLLAAGFSVSADQSCIQQEIAVGTTWKRTRVGVAFNPYQEVLTGGAVRVDEAFTLSMMQFCRTTLAAQCVLENNSIRFPPLDNAYTDMYASMQSLGAPISFQTATATRIGDLSQTLAWAVTEGADAVELPLGYQTTPIQTLAAAAQALRLNPA